MAVPVNSKLKHSIASITQYDFLREGSTTPIPIRIAQAQLLSTQVIIQNRREGVKH
jgi:hypothetical protein